MCLYKSLLTFLNLLKPSSMFQTFWKLVTADVAKISICTTMILQEISRTF